MNANKREQFFHRLRVFLLILGAIGFIALGGYRVYAVQSRPMVTAQIENHWVDSYRSGNTNRTRDCYTISYAVNARSFQTNLCTDEKYLNQHVPVLYDPEDPASVEFAGAGGVFKQALLWGFVPLFAWFFIVLYSTNALEELADKRASKRRRKKNRS